MKQFLNKIRTPQALSFRKKVINSALIFLAGSASGLIAKMLDETAANDLPLFLQPLDLRNFFSRMGVWLFAGICISIYSRTPLRAALNSFLFFAGMVPAYYAYTVFVVGFYPWSYMMIWAAMTFLSPFAGAVCWYAKGTHTISVSIAALIFLIMTRQAFAFGFWYLDLTYGPEFLLWLAVIPVLYKSRRQILTVIAGGVLLFFLTSRMHLFWGML